MTTLLLFLICLAALGFFWMVFLKKKPEPPKSSSRASEVYVCDQCGARDCECRLDKPSS